MVKQDAIESSVVAVIKRKYYWSPELDDLLIIAREAVAAEREAGKAQSSEQLTQYAIRRAGFDCIDYLRAQTRNDPVRRARRLANDGGCLIPPVAPKAPTLMMSARLPVPLAASLHKAAMLHKWSLSETLRNALEQGLEVLG